MSTKWTRNDSIRLGEISQQLGLLPNDAGDALTLGARFQAHGFTAAEVNDMISWQYRQWSEDQRAMETKTATPSQARRFWERTKRDD